MAAGAALEGAADVDAARVAKADVVPLAPLRARVATDLVIDEPTALALLEMSGGRG